MRRQRPTGRTLAASFHPGFRRTKDEPRDSSCIEL